MRTWVSLTLISFSLALLSGCTGANRSRMLAPFQPLNYGQTCVAPPATGTIGYGQGYYQPRAFTAAAPQTGFSSQRGPMQPIPQLSRPNTPAQPRTSAAPPSNDDWESTKSANAPTLNSSASRQPAPRVNVANHQRRADTRGLTNDNNLAWTPPFGTNQGYSPVSAASQRSYGRSNQPLPMQRPVQQVVPQLATYSAPVSYNPIRPSVVRPTSYGPVVPNQIFAEDCVSCDVQAAPGVPIPQGSYASGGYDSGPIYTAVESSRWQPRR